MPLLIQESQWEWSETEEKIHLRIPQMGVPAKKVDLYVNDSYVKANYPPYFFELDLYDRVDAQSSKATLADGYIRFELIKIKLGLWGKLRFQEEDRDSEQQQEQEQEEGMSTSFSDHLQQRRKAAIARAEEWAREEEKRKTKAKFEKEQYLVKQQMDVERKERERIAAIKQQEKTEAEMSVKEWVGSGTGDNVPRNSAKDIFEQNGDVTASKVKGRQVPGPRAATEIRVQFTPRILPTPAREQKDQETLKIVKRVQERAQMTDEDRKEEEKNVLFLRDKGKQFFAQGNLEAACNAFSSALDLVPTDTGLLANRAACNLKLKRFEACIEDCIKALDTVQWEQQKRASSTSTTLDGTQEEWEQRLLPLKKKLLARRGAASLGMGNKLNAIRDYERALEMDPRDVQLQADLLALQQEE